MSVVITESDNGTKGRVKQTLRDISTELPAQVAQELEDVWNRIWMDAIDLCPKKTGALAASINVISGGIGVGGGLGQERTARSPISNWIFDRTIVAGDETVINPETGKTTAEYAEWVHDGHIMRDGTFWEGVPFLTQALMAHEAELEAAVAKAMKELGIDRGD
jgi:hypothetical protein